MMNTLANQSNLKRSVLLTPLEKEKLNVFLARYTTTTEAAKMLNIDRGSLIRIIQFGSGNSVNVEKIKLKIKHVKIPIVEQK